MRLTRIQLSGIGIILLCAGVAYLAFAPHQAVVPQILSQEAQAASSTAGMPAVQTLPAPPLSQTYTNRSFGFSLQMPAGFHASELPPDPHTGARTILLQDDAGQGIQILITPAKDAPDSLTAADVRANIPDMKVFDEQPVEIGSGDTGVAFLSDNDAFGGASREVWFYFRGNLYQISTYAKLDPLLKEMFGTWKFF